MRNYLFLSLVKKTELHFQAQDNLVKHSQYKRFNELDVWFKGKKVHPIDNIMNELFFQATNMNYIQVLDRKISS